MKKVFLSMFFLMSICYAYSECVPIAEVVIYDDDGNIVSNHRSVSKDLCEWLSKKWFDGCVEFTSVSQSKTGPVTSSFDAIKACNLIESQYIVYGYLKKSSVNYYCELKLYNKEIAKVQKVFFATDDLDNYDRLVMDVSDKIENYFIESFGIKTEADKADDLHLFELALPASIYYWGPINNDWSDVLMGIIGINTGIEMYPCLPVKYVKNRQLDISFRLLIDYRYGMGAPNSYSMNYHALAFQTPIVFNYYLDKKKSVSFGMGPLYEFDFAQIEKKYENSIWLRQNQFGLEFLVGYYYYFTDNIKLRMELESDFYMIDYSYCLLKPHLGIVWNFYRGNKK